MARRTDLPRHLPANAPRHMWVKYLKGLDEQIAVAKEAREKVRVKKSRVRLLRPEMGDRHQMEKAIEHPSPIGVKKLVKAMENPKTKLEAAQAILHLGKFTSEINDDKRTPPKRR